MFGEQDIIECEQALRLAMLSSDIEALDRLLAPDLLFTNHLGHIVSKTDDIDAHRTGMLRIDRLELSEQRIMPVGDVVTVSVRAKLSGTYDQQTASGEFRFTRIWAQTDKTQADTAQPNRWQVVVAHSSLLA